MKRSTFKTIAASLAAAALALVAACATPTPYQALTKEGSSIGGYTDQKISDNQFRVIFQGNSLTPRETVERYLLFRSAELTKEQGFDWFETVDRDTERQVDQYDVPITDTEFAYTPTLISAGGDKYTVIYTLQPYWVDRYQTEARVRYQAIAQIYLGRGTKPANNTKAFDAAEVLANLGPTLQRPEIKE